MADYWREKELEASAHALCIMELFEELIEAAIEDDPIEFYHWAYQTAASIHKILEPDGERRVQPIRQWEMNPQEGAQILNLERYREALKRGVTRTIRRAPSKAPVSDTS